MGAPEAAEEVPSGAGLGGSKCDSVTPFCIDMCTACEAGFAIFVYYGYVIRQLSNRALTPE